ncbi:MAG: hypothetical protein ABUK08_05980, partial [Candidatus Humimicrobiaceae bacterium]
MSGFFKKTLSFFGLADEEEIEMETEAGNILPDRKNIGGIRKRNIDPVAPKRTSRKKVSLI